MPNIATALRTEISRLARKEVRAEVIGLRKAFALQRSEIAALKRKAAAAEHLKRTTTRAESQRSKLQAVSSSGSHRFSAKRLAAHRHRLGLSAGDFGLLFGVTAQSIYNWEEGKVRPRVEHMPAIASLRKLDKRQATAHLDSIRPNAQNK